MNLTPQRKRLNSRCLLAFVAALLLFGSNLFAGITIQGPSGFINVPSQNTVKVKEIELSVKNRMFKVPASSREAHLTYLGFAFSPVRDFEFAVSKAIDSRNSVNEPDPTLSFKVKLPPLGFDELAEAAVGVVFDVNPNNYHTAYFTLGGFGVGYNFGGNRFSGMANYGKYNSAKNEPESFCLLIGTEYPRRRPGQRGYQTQYFIDYNGDVFAAGVRYGSHRGFSAEASVQSKSSYDGFYDYRPLVIGLGANF